MAKYQLLRTLEHDLVVYVPEAIVHLVATAVTDAEGVIKGWEAKSVGHGGKIPAKVIAPGETVELTPIEAAPLIAAGTVAPAGEPGPGVGGQGPVTGPQQPAAGKKS
jgi:hypothetical protein